LEGREGKEKRETLFSSARGGESLRGREAQESKRSDPGLTDWGARRGHSFPDGRKPLEHTMKAVRFSWGVQEGNGTLKRVSDHLGGRKL
jgi:hypothetical protein